MFDINEFEENFLDEEMNNIKENLNLKVPQINQPVRIALTGSTSHHLWEQPCFYLVKKNAYQNQSINKLSLKQALQYYKLLSKVIYLITYINCQEGS